MSLLANLSVSTFTKWGRILLVAILTGGAYYVGVNYQQGMMQGYEAVVEAPITARYDIMEIYSKSPFQKMEIQFPPSEISTRFVVRVWVTKNTDSMYVEEELRKYMTNFYTKVQSSIYIRLTALDLEISALKAEEFAKAFELNYLRKHYADLRKQRIEQLADEYDSIQKKVEEKQYILKQSQIVKGVEIQTFKTFTSRRMAIAVITQSVLVGLFIALLLVCWLQQRHYSNVNG
jgi:hypothetical protein